MRVHVLSILVDDQARALAFYTDVLGFVKKEDVPVGEYRWLTVVPADAPESTEILLEPDQHPAARTYKAALFADGIPATSLAVEDLEAVCARLRERGVRFVQEPTAMGPVSTAVFDDTCGNLIQLTELAG